MHDDQVTQETIDAASQRRLRVAIEIESILSQTKAAKRYSVTAGGYRTLRRNIAAIRACLDRLSAEIGE